MRTIERRVEKLESCIGEKPLQIIVVNRDQTEEQALSVFYEQYPQCQGTIIVIIKKGGDAI